MIKTKRLILRPLKWADLNDYNEYAKIKMIGYNSGWKPHESRLDTLLAISRIKDSSYHYAIEFEGKMIGTCSAQPDDKRQGVNALMLGYSLNPAFWGKGLATEAAAALLEKAFLGNATLVSAYCYPENAPSKRVLEKCGFRKEGTLEKSFSLYNGEVKDVDCYIITAEEYFLRRKE